LSVNGRHSGKNDGEPAGFAEKKEADKSRKNWQSGRLTIGLDKENANVFLLKEWKPGSFTNLDSPNACPKISR